MMDFSNAVLVGNSVGGYAACRLTMERPERVAGVVLINTGGFTPHSVFTRFFCAVMGRPTVIKAVFPAFVRAYMRAKNPTDEAVVDRVVARAKTDGGARTRLDHQADLGLASRPDAAPALRGSHAMDRRWRRAALADPPWFDAGFSQAR